MAQGSNTSAGKSAGFVMRPHWYPSRAKLPDCENRYRMPIAPTRCGTVRFNWNRKLIAGLPMNVRRSSSAAQTASTAEISVEVKAMWKVNRNER